MHLGALMHFLVYFVFFLDRFSTVPRPIAALARHFHYWRSRTWPWFGFALLFAKPTRSKGIFLSSAHLVQVFVVCVTTCFCMCARVHSYIWMDVCKCVLCICACVSECICMHVYVCVCWLFADFHSKCPVSDLFHSPCH